MSLKKFLLLSVVITIFALIYVQMQVSIYDLAYQGKSREDQVERLVDRNTDTMLNIARLKSARSVGNWFSEKNTEVVFVSQNNIVEVKSSSVHVENIRLASIPKNMQNTMNLLTQFFSLRSIAEAKPIR